jgi:hypothetical protein
MRENTSNSLATIGGGKREKRIHAKKYFIRKLIENEIKNEF